MPHRLYGMGASSAHSDWYMCSGHIIVIAKLHLATWLISQSSGSSGPYLGKLVVVWMAAVDVDGAAFPESLLTL